MWISFKGASYWINEIRDYDEDILAIIIGNMWDDEDIFEKLIKDFWKNII